MKNILYESTNGVAKITINRPPLNVLNTETLAEIVAALESIQKDETVNIVVITGAGERAFSAGVDVKDHFADKIAGTLELFHKVFHLLIDIEKPTIAMVNGFAFGGGCELAMACDIVIASEKAQFGQQEISVGAIPTVATALLPKIVGRKKAFELMFTGNTITAEEAQKIGLVNLVVPADKLEEKTNELVAKLKEKSPIVLKLLRKSIYEGLDMDFKRALDNVTNIYLKRLIKTEDAEEGLRAFLEKRKPQWKGK
ncbi:MAG: enoyl-CoA hydratase/isomerase family protein [Candidatus Bathyarchaeia archaeon]